MPEPTRLEGAPAANPDPNKSKPGANPPLHSAKELALAKLVTRLKAEQREHWQRGYRLLVENYLTEQPSLLGQNDIILDLLAGEISLRRERGEGPRLEEYLQRFPQYRAQLEQQFALHGGLVTGDYRGTTLTPPPIMANADNHSPAVPPPRDGQGEGARATAATPWPRVAGYEILRELGHGGMGIVYEARQLGLNRLVALKMIRSGHRARPDELARFRREAQAVAQLVHPNIVQIYDIGEQDGWPYFSLEHVDGGSLTQRLAGQPQPAREAAQLVETLARAMNYAHQRGIIHRDLKPANVLLTSAGIPKITDFGLAKHVEHDAGQTQSGVILGTPSYMAPEQTRGITKEIGPHSNGT